MTDPLKPNRLTEDQRAHLEERQGERMRDTTEFDNLKADIRQSRGRDLVMPWSTGRPLKSAGMDANGDPITPLAAIDLAAIALPTEQAAFNRELDRVVVHDAISEGVLDQAESQGVPLEVTDQWWENDPQNIADEAQVAAKLKEAASANQLQHPPTK